MRTSEVQALHAARVGRVGRSTQAVQVAPAMQMARLALAHAAIWHHKREQAVQPKSIEAGEQRQ